MRRRPYSCVLFDEVEKAHPDVFNVLLQVLDEGHLTDSKGRHVDFKNTVLILTSNIGSQYILDYQMDSAAKGDEATYDVMKEKVLDALREHFRPEFLNRVDETVVFHALSQSELKNIVDLQMKLLNKRLEDRKFRLELGAAAADWLARTGYDPMYGARPLKRLIQRDIENPLSMEILEGNFVDGDTIAVDVAPDGEGLVFHKTASAPAESTEPTEPTERPTKPPSEPHSESISASAPVTT